MGNILRQKRKSRIKLSKRSVLLVIFFLIMSTFAWFTYSRLLSGKMKMHIMSWNIEYYEDENKNWEAEKNLEDNPDYDETRTNPIQISLTNLYPGMDDQSTTILIKNTGETDALIEYTIPEVTILGDVYSIIDPNEVPEDERPEHYIVENTPSVSDLNVDSEVPNTYKSQYLDTVSKGIKTYNFIDDSTKLPFKIIITNTVEVLSDQMGYLRVICRWDPYPDESAGQTADEKDELDTLWGYKMAEALSSDNPEFTSPLTMKVYINSIGAESNEDQKSLYNLITAENYGDYINYPVDLNGDGNYSNDWKIFYKNSVGNENTVYLISANYVDWSKNTLNTTAMSIVSQLSEPFGVKFTDTNLSSASNTIIAPTKYMYTQMTPLTVTNSNFKAVSNLLNTEYWENFLDDTYADSVIGAPTLEMFVGSWNAKYSSDTLHPALYYLYDETTDGSGYLADDVTPPVEYATEVVGYNLDGTSLYFPHTVKVINGKNCYGYWLASPSGKYASNLLSVMYNGYIETNNYEYNYLAVRPVVALKSNIQAVLNNTYWNLNDEIEEEQDEIPPVLQSLEITTPPTGTYPEGQEITFVATFDEIIYGSIIGEAVNEENAPELSIKIGEGAPKNAKFASSTGNNIVYKYVIEAGDNGVVMLNSYTGSVYDSSGNKLEIAEVSLSGNTITAEAVLPECVITSNTSNPTNADNITFTFTFNKQLSSDELTIDDIILTNGTKGTFTEIEENKKYTLEVTSAENLDDSLKIMINENAVQDLNGNYNDEILYSIDIDKVAPHYEYVSKKIVVSSSEVIAKKESNSLETFYSSDFKTVYVKFKVIDSHKITSTLSANDISIKVNGEIATYSNKNLQVESANEEIVYTLTLENIEGEGNLSIEIPSGKVKDVLNNTALSWTMSTGNMNISIDNEPPVIIVSPNIGSVSKSQTITITVQEGESQTPSGLSNSNSYQYYLSRNVNVLEEGSWIDYQSGVPFTIGENLTGTYYLWVKGISDKAGNTVPNQVYGTYIFDNTPPKLISLMVTSPESGTYGTGEEITIVATYSEDIYGTNTQNIATSSTAPALNAKFGTGSGKVIPFYSASDNIITYKYELEEGDMGLMIACSYVGSVYDIVGNELSITNMALTGSEIEAATEVIKLEELRVTNPESGIYGKNQEVIVFAEYNRDIYGSNSKTTVNESTAPVLKIKFGNGESRDATFKSIVENGIYYSIFIQQGDNGNFTLDSYIGTLYDDSGASSSIEVLNETESPYDFEGNEIIADTTAPTITVTPSSAEKVKNVSALIEVEDPEPGAGLSSSNDYKYYLSTSILNTIGGVWTSYENGSSVVIGTGLTGTYYLWIRGVKDQVGNSASNKYVGMFKFDNTSPVCSITANKTSPTNAETITYTFTFDEVLGDDELTIDDITVTNGTKGTFTETTENRIYTLEVTSESNQDSLQTVEIAESVVKDEAGNENDVASKSIYIDRIKPVWAYVSKEVIITETEEETGVLTNSTQIYTNVEKTVILKFKITDSHLGTIPLSVDDISIFVDSNSAVYESATLESLNIINGKEFTLTIVNLEQDGNLSIVIPQGSVEDTAGNESVEWTMSTGNINTTVDNIKPIITIIKVKKNGTEITEETYSKSSDSFEITFDVTDANYETNTTKNPNLTVDDFTLQINGQEITPTTKSLASATSISNGMEYKLNISGISGDGDLEIVIPQSKVKDKAGNANSKKVFTLASTKTILDNTAPSLEIEPDHMEDVKVASVAINAEDREIWTQYNDNYISYVTNGTIVAEVGTEVTGYSVTAFGTEYGDGKWYILGAEDGRLLITTNANVKTSTSSSQVTLGGQSGYTSGVSTLDTLAENYQNSTFAESARNINIGDLNRLTGYNPETARCYSGQVSEYGNEVTYTLNSSDGKIHYQGTIRPAEDTEGSQTSFTYWNGSAWKTLTSGESSLPIKTNAYYYYPNTLKTTSSGTLVGIDTSSNAYNVIFANTKADGSDYSKCYWLGSNYAFASDSGSANFGSFCISNGHVDNKAMYISNGSTGSYSLGVRPTVTLKSSIKAKWSDGKIELTSPNNSQVGLASSNEYKYYLSTSSTSCTGGTWLNYASNVEFNIGNGLTGTYYLWAKGIADSLGNSISDQMLGTYVFDNITPTVTATPNTSSGEETVDVTITIEDSGSYSSGLSTSNEYRYYLSSSSTTQSDGEWVDYTSGEEFTIGEGLTDTYYLWIKPVSDNAGNTANLQVIGTYAFSYTTSPEVKALPEIVENEKDASVTITATDSGGLYTKIDETNYGDYVNYPVDLNGDGNTSNDWKIFYKNNTGGDNTVYIISADYVDWTKQTLNTTYNTLANSPYTVNWSSSNISNASSSIVAPNKYMYSRMLTLATTNNNFKAMSNLLNTASWSNLVNSTYATSAIGSPTIEMFVSSWNEKFDEVSGYSALSYEYDETSSGSGYWLFTNGGTRQQYVSVGGYDAENASLYFPHTSTVTSGTGNCTGYWIASPGSENSNTILTVNYQGTIDCSAYNLANYALRPVVALKSNIQASKDSNNVWQLLSQTVTPSGLSSSNSYKYYLSTSKASVQNGSWKNYTSGTSVTIGTGLTGTYYLWAKGISDNKGTSIEDKVIGTYKFDNTAPTCTITTDEPNSTNANTITYTFTFSEKLGVNELTSDDITVINGTKGTFTETEENKVYTLEVSTVDNNETTQTVTLPAEVVADLAGNLNESATKTVNVDRLPPEWSYVSKEIKVTSTNVDTLAETNSTNISYTNVEKTVIVKFKGTDANFASSTLVEADLSIKVDGVSAIYTSRTLTSQTLTNGILYTLTIVNLQQNGNLSIDIPSGKLTDTFGATSIAWSMSTGSINITVDNTLPTLTASPNSAVDVQNVEVTITAEDGGAISSGLVSGTEYQFYLSTSNTEQVNGEWYNYTSGTPFTIGEGLNGTYYLWAKGITDNAGNSRPTAVIGTYTFSNTRPSCTITSNAVANPTNADTIIYTFTFSRALGTDELTSADITVENGIKGIFTEVTENTVYTLEVTTLTNQNSTQTVSIAENVVADQAGNLNTSASRSVVVDKVLPAWSYVSKELKVTETNVDEVAETSNTTQIFTNIEKTLIVKFKVLDTHLSTVNITTSNLDIKVNGTTAVYEDITLTSANITNGKQYTLSLKNIEADGNLTIGIPLNAAEDTAGNKSLEWVMSVGNINTTVDNTKPTIYIEEDGVEVNNTVIIDNTYIDSSDTVTVMFDATDLNFESGLTSNDITVKVDGTAVTPTTKNLATADLTYGKKYTLTLSGISGNGELQIAIPAKAVLDKSGNGNIATTFGLSDLHIILDNTAPTLTATPDEANNVRSVDVTIDAVDEGGLIGTSLYSQIIAENYGDYVNYPVDLNGNGNNNDDWRIFYKNNKDGTNNVFLIAADYVDWSENTLPTNALAQDSSRAPYDVYWSSTNLSNSINIGTSSNAQSKYEFSQMTSSTLATGNDNYKAISTLLNTSYWSSFVNSTYASSAIGSPTVEMFMNSWNAKFSGNTSYSNLTCRYDYSSSGSGYYVKKDSDAENYYVSVTGYNGTGANLYFPYTSDVTSGSGSCSGYWLASPAEHNSNSVCSVTRYGYMDANVYYSGTIFAVRPVVSLKSDIPAKQSSGVWILGDDSSGLSSSNTYQYYLSTSSTECTGGTWTNYTPGTSFTLTMNSSTTYYLWAKGISDNVGNSIPDQMIGTYLFDVTAPTMTLSKNSNSSPVQTDSVQVTLADSGSGLASGIDIEYGWSTSNTVPPTSYSTATLSYTAGASSTSFTATATGLTGEYYLWVVPQDETLKDCADNINYDELVSTGTFKFDNEPPTLTATPSTANNVTSQEVTITASDVAEASLYSQITASNYGDYVDYPVDLNDDGDTTNDWRIFYMNNKDGTNNVFLIAADYVDWSINTLPTNALDQNTSYAPYDVYWASAQLGNSINIGTSSNAQSKYEFSQMTSSVLATGNNNYKAISTLLNTSYWSSFVNSTYASSAIGSPTVEMFMNSWNAKFSGNSSYSNLTCRYVYSSSGRGYYVKKDSDAESYYVSVTGYNGTGADLYWPHTSTVTSGSHYCFGYWLASPSEDYYHDVLSVHCSGSVTKYGYNTCSYFSVRPVVSLKSDISATQNQEGIWSLVIDSGTSAGSSISSGLSSSNTYQYYLSTSSTECTGGTWTNYTSGTTFTIGTGITGTRYLWAKGISDTLGNSSQDQVIGTYTFDNTSPEWSYVSKQVAVTSSGSTVLAETSSTDKVTVDNTHTVTIKFKVTDDNFSSSSLEESNLTITINGSTATYTSKTLTSSSLTNGKQYTLTLVGMEKSGTLSIIIPADKAEDMAGNSALAFTLSVANINVEVENSLYDQITASNYGDYVNYPVDLNGDGDTTNDWRIFYKNDTDGTNNVFLIAADYVDWSENTLPTSALAQNSSYAPYDVYWSSTQLANSINISTSTYAEAKYDFSQMTSSSFSTSKNNYKATSTLLNTSYWTSFVDSTYASSAIGSPTIEMFVDSWNEKFSGDSSYSTLSCQYSSSYSGKGYYVKKDSGSYGSTVQSISGYTQTAANLYWPHTSTVTSGSNYCYGYWLSSPNGYGSNYVIYIGYNGISTNQYNNTKSSAVRPLVCLNDNIVAEQNSDDVWILEEQDNTAPEWSYVSKKIALTSSGTVVVAETSSNDEVYVNSEKTVILKFKVEDDNFNSSTLAESDLTITVDESTASYTSKTLASSDITNGKQYTLTIVGLTGNGVLTVAIPAGKAIDQSGNYASSFTLSVANINAKVDNTAPEISVSPSSASDVSSQSITITAYDVTEAISTSTCTNCSGLGKVTCTYCGGDGIIACTHGYETDHTASNFASCTNCGGDGKLACAHGYESSHTVSNYATCSTCSGTGSVTTSTTCSGCGGTGYYPCGGCYGSGQVSALTTTTTVCPTCLGTAANKTCSVCSYSYRYCSNCSTTTTTNSGSSSCAHTKNCSTCSGTGYNPNQPHTPCNGTGSISSTSSCTNCGGDGLVSGTCSAWSYCSTCGGDGLVSGTCTGWSNCSLCDDDGKITCSVCSGAGEITNSTEIVGHLDSTNTFEYYLSTSSTSLQGDTWHTYTSGTAFTIGQNAVGDTYLFVKQIYDSAGNVSITEGTPVTIDGTTYLRFGTYSFIE